MRTPLVAGNWKLHKTVDESRALAAAIVESSEAKSPGVEVVLAPVFTALSAVRLVLEGTPVALSAQDLHYADFGAFTGEVSAPLLIDVGCTYVIVGHSERRQHFGDTDEVVSQKTQAALAHSLTPIVCVGETLAERESGSTHEVVGRQIDAVIDALSPDQLERVVIAYEPVWAIGTGKVAAARDAQEVHAMIRDRLANKDAGAAAKVRILYGGSVKPNNARELMEQADIDGALVGGASLDAESFRSIIGAAAG